MKYFTITTQEVTAMGVRGIWGKGTLCIKSLWWEQRAWDELETLVCVKLGGKMEVRSSHSKSVSPDSLSYERRPGRVWRGDMTQSLLLGQKVDLAMFWNYSGYSSKRISGGRKFGGVLWETLNWSSPEQVTLSQGVCGTRDREAEAGERDAGHEVQKPRGLGEGQQDVLLSSHKTQGPSPEPCKFNKTQPLGTDSGQQRGMSWEEGEREAESN